MKHSFNSLIATLTRQLDKNKTISVGEVLFAFRRRGFGPLLFIPALLLVLPTGGIPGFPFVCGLLIIFFAGQILIGRHSPWLPHRLKKISIDSARLKSGLERITPATDFIDRYTLQRLSWFVSPLAKRIIALICVFLALCVIPLGIIPFAMFLPALAILFFGLGLSINDGVLIAVGLLIALAFGALSFFWWL